VSSIHVDVLPTLAEIAGAKLPDQPLDGESLVKLFRDPSSKLRREAIYQHFPGYLGAGPGSWRTTPVSLIQAGEFKLMEFLEDGRLELYNLKDDIGETNNLAQSMPEKARELHSKLVAWRKEIHAPMPTPNDPKAAKSETAKKGKGGKGKKKAKAN
jgi:arylsulfatase A-like enzyme